MRTRLVVWGHNAEDQRVLLAVALNADENKVDIWSIPERAITEEFYNEMMSKWREGLEVILPDTAMHEISELTIAEGILPLHLKVEKSDIIQRAQMEWHFVVLSTKLYKNFKSELEELTDKIKRLENYDGKLWDELKSLWDNVQKHIYDKNLFRDHADSLKERANSLFEEMKKLRSAFTQEINAKSKEAFHQILEKLSVIEQKIQSGAVLKPLFDDLKTLQDEYKKLSMNRGDREKLMSKINDAFKLIREKRDQRQANHNHDNNTSERLSKRFDGLLGAIQKMESSIAFEKRNIEFENKRIASTSGQLEAQIRQAKIQMIEERIRSKQEKLDELLKTKDKLEKVTENLKKREEKLAVKRAHQKLVKSEEEKIKAKITEEIHQAQEHISTEEQEKLNKAAEEIIASKKAKPKKAVANNDIEPVQPDEAIEAATSSIGEDGASANITTETAAELVAAEQTQEPAPGENLNEEVSVDIQAEKSVE